MCFLGKIFSIMSPLEIILEGRLDCIRLKALYSPLEHNFLEEDSQRAIYAVGIPLVFSNGVVEKDPNNLLTDSQIHEIRELFSNKKLPFIYWSYPEEKEKKDFTLLEICKGIVLDLNHTISLSINLSPHIKIKQVNSEKELKDFVDICQITYTFDSLIAEQFYAVHRSLLKENLFSYFIAYSDEKPAGALALCRNTVAGIWNLSTLAEYRNQGIATALVQSAILEAKKYHYTHIMGMLNQRQLAKNIFEKLGFQIICDLPCFVYKSMEKDL